MTTFWFKTPRDETPTWGNIHPVLDHIIDVGLVFERLIDGVWCGIGDYLVSLYDEPGPPGTFCARCTTLERFPQDSPKRRANSSLN